VGEDSDGKKGWYKKYSRRLTVSGAVLLTGRSLREEEGNASASRRWSPTQFQCPPPATSVDGLSPSSTRPYFPLYYPPKQQFHLLLLDLIPYPPFPLIFAPSPTPSSPQLRSLRSPVTVSWTTLLACICVFILFYFISLQRILLFLFLPSPISPVHRLSHWRSSHYAPH
jgi:hypothetical protein